MAERVPMTPAGCVRLREEMQRLRDVAMPAIVKDIGTARDHGDLSENAEYHAAKDRQGMIHARIKYIEDVLSRAEVIDPSKLAGDRVVFGAFVTVLNVDSEEQIAYQIVGTEESDLKSGRISVSSPLARSLIGKRVGEEVSVQLPAGNRSYEILAISFA
ncbi:MAG: transcription elongation factor GreA [Myxococcales bacterium]|nr:transcription elongation factor GreA [Myxococcales bacterium]